MVIKRLMIKTKKSALQILEIEKQYREAMKQIDRIGEIVEKIADEYYGKDKE